MKAYKFILIIVLISVLACEQDTDNDIEKPDYEFVPTDVLVKIKGSFTINKVFDFINSLDLDVENIHSQVYTSNLPSDSLQYVLNYLNKKPYTNDGNTWFVNGYLHYQTKVITIFPRFFDIKNKPYQLDWLDSMKILKLKEQTEGETAGCIIFFHVPEGKEMEWNGKRNLKNMIL
ncbi:hypothetical protein DF185_17375 [Marinifilum breve]|uniref:Lipoprotein n=1 Tax=Marinifilum breve TaxID=2184082 RepID=A0A2V3ZTK1_9BACT|nr:hypothetical protein [Marinifilum breve]PXX97741.1 hypothetical protein DF185_17375 [Marinifilum breve]